jgi:hypothetical protein
MSSTGFRSTRFRSWLAVWKWSLAALLLLIVVVGTAQAALMKRPAKVLLLDDEGAYLPTAQRLAARKHSPSFLPGTLPFEHRPPLAPVVFAYAAEGARGGPAALQSIRKLNLACFLVLLGLTYATSAALGLGPRWSLLGPSLLALSGYFWSYLHTAHSELIHSVFLGVALLSLVRFGRRRRLAHLSVCGFFLGLALLTRGSLQPFVLALVPFVAVDAYLAERSAKSPLRGRWFLPTASALALLLGLGLSAGPQLFANWMHGKGARISANTWRNLEFGLQRSAPGDPPGFPALRWKDANRSYAQGGRGLLAREEASKLRTLQYLRTHDVGTLVLRQVRKVVARFVDPEPLLDSSRLPSRIGGLDARGLELLRSTSRIAWYGVLVFGFAGVLVSLSTGFGFRVLALFLVAFLLGFLLVPTSRLFMPAVPVLCLTAAAFFRAATGRIRTTVLRYGSR